MSVPSTVEIGVDHPARFSDSVLEAVRPWLDREHVARFGEQADHHLKILDPFAGVGRVHELHAEHGDETWGVELEPEWGSQHPRTVVGNSLNPPFRDRIFHVLFSSACYGNRLADTYDGRDGTKRFTYRIYLGRMPSPDSGAVLQYGQKYRDLHERVMVACLPKLVDDGLVIMNMSNHLRTVRQGDPQIEIHVVEWWVAMFMGLGLRLLAVEPVATPRIGFGSNQQDKAETEFLLVFRKTPAHEGDAAGQILSRHGQLSLL